MRKFGRHFMILALSGLFVACAGHKSEPAPPTASTPLASMEHEHHHHTAPHGGALVVLGEEFAHLEFVLDPELGALTAYVLDGEADQAVQLSTSQLELELKSGSRVSLLPVADELTGETEQSTSTFRAQSDSFKELKSFEATLVSIEIKSKTFKNVPFTFPEGNEAPDSHERESH